MKTMLTWRAIIQGLVCLPNVAGAMQGTDWRAMKVDTSFTFAVPELRDSVWVEVYVPAGVRHVRGVIAFVDRALDRYAYDDRDWRAMCARAQCALLRLGLPRQDEAPPASQIVRNATLGGGAALLRALVVAAERTRRPEIREANALVFGFSAAGSFAATFASSRPERTIGFIQYHSNLRGIGLDTAALVAVPALLITGASDRLAGSEDSRTLWRQLRSRLAPWAFVNHRGQPHYSVDGVVEAGPLMRAWAEAVLDSRQNASSTDRSRLAPLRIANGWLVNDSTKAVLEATSATSSQPGTSWVPNADIAQELRLLSGVCALVPVAEVAVALGSTPKVASEDVADCRYTVGSEDRDLWLTVYRAASTSEARAVVEQNRGRANGRVEVAVGESAYFAAEPDRKCSTIGAAQSSRVFYATLCGEGFGTPTDSARLLSLTRRFLGLP